MIYRFGPFTLDSARRELSRDGAEIAVEPQVFDLLRVLIERRDRVVSRDDLLEAVWNGRIVSEATLGSRITAARTAIGDTGTGQRWIRTLPRKGVRFVGATLWSDWSLAGRWLAPDAPDRPADPVAFAAARMTDPVTGSREYRAIRQGDGTAWTPQAAMAAHAEDRARLAAALARPHAGPTVAVTHHPPIAEAADRYRDAPGVPWWVPAFYATTLLADLPAADRPAAWISGHFHAGHDMRLHGTRCVANPVEGAGCDPALIVAV